MDAPACIRYHVGPVPAMPLAAPDEEFMDVFFDTRDAALRQRNIWLRCREKIEDRAPVMWTLRESGHSETRGKTDVMAALRQLLGDVGAPRSPISYCECAVVAMRTRRYHVVKTARFKHWIDVCFFRSVALFYTVATMETSDPSLIVGAPAPTKLSVYLSRYKPDMTSVTWEVMEPLVRGMITTEDPVSRAPFEAPRRTYSDSDDDGSNSSDNDHENTYSI